MGGWIARTRFSGFDLADSRLKAMGSERELFSQQNRGDWRAVIDQMPTSQERRTKLVGSQ